MRDTVRLEVREGRAEAEGLGLGWAGGSTTDLNAVPADASATTEVVQ